MAAILDTNILVRLRDASNPAHADCTKLLSPRTATSADLRVCAQNLIEYWVVATRPRQVNGLGLTPDEAEADLRDLLLIVPLVPEPPDVAAHWLAIVAAHRVTGKPAHDVRLVALMRASGISKIVTLNTADFARFPGIQCFTPAQMLARTP